MCARMLCHYSGDKIPATVMNQLGEKKETNTETLVVAKLPPCVATITATAAATTATTTERYNLSPFNRLQKSYNKRHLV